MLPPGHEGRSEAPLRGLQIAESHLRMLFEHGIDAVLLMTLEGQILLANPAATAMFGYGEDELRRLGCPAIIDLDDPCTRRALEERQRTGRFRGEITMRRKDGTRFPAEVSSSVFHDAQPTAYTTLFVRDIGERRAREAEHERRHAAADAERQWYKTVLDHVPMGLVLIRHDGSLFFNRYSEEMFGLSLSPTGGTAQYAHLLRYRDGSPVPPDQMISARVLRTGETVIGAEFIIVHPDGRRIPILGSGAPIKQADGTPCGGVGIFQDVSERMLAEEAVRTSERLLQAVIELMPVGLWILDRAGTIVRVNPAARQIWRGSYDVGSTDLTVRKGWWMASGQPIAPDAWPVERALRHAETTLDALVRVETADGRTLSLVNSAMPLLGEDQQFIGAIAVHKDVTALVEAETALRKALQARNEMMGIVAHDLRNPLNVIQIQAQCLQQCMRNADACDVEALDCIRNQVRRMNRLVQDLLDVARIEARALGLKRTVVTVERLLRSLIKPQKALLDAAEVLLALELREPDLAVWADADRVLQALENLVTNATRFSPRGATITIGAAQRGEDALLWVADQGPGIAEDQLAHIFDHFWKADRADRGGAGLGLAIVKGIVESHGGRVWAESRIGAGSTFFFTLPTKQASP